MLLCSRRRRASHHQVCGEMALHGHSAPVTCLASCGLEATDRDLVLSGAADGTALLWSLRRLVPSYISDTLHRPTARRSPALVVRGHRGPLTSCALSDGLGLALTCSDGRALLTAIEGNVLLRALRRPAPVAKSSDDRVVALADEAWLPTPAIRYTACALVETGFAVLGSSRLDASFAEPPFMNPRYVHELEVYTVNGRRTSMVSGLSGAVRCLSTTGRGELLVIGGDRLMLEVRTTAELRPVWSLDPTSWATIDRFPGAGIGPGGRGGIGSAAQGREVEVEEADWPSVECVELGPNAGAPVLMCVGTSDGSLLVQVS